MGTTNYGTQKLTFDYKNVLQGKDFNTINLDVLPTGVYTGNTLTSINPTTCQITGGVLLIQNRLDTVSSPDQVLRCETQDATFNITMSSSTPYIVARLEWYDQEDIYVDFLAVAPASLESTDVILGKIIFSGASPVDISYEETTYSSLVELKNNLQAFQVVKDDLTDNSDNTLSITGGIALINQDRIFKTDSTTTITATVSSNMISLILLDNTGTIIVRESADTGSPVLPTVYAEEILLARIDREAGTGVKSENIQSYHNILKQTSNIHDIKEETLNLGSGTSSPVLNLKGDLNGRISINSNSHIRLDNDNDETDFLKPINASSTSTFAGQMSITNITDSTSSSTGCLILSGGLGVAKDLFVGGGLLNIGGSTVSSNTFLNFDSTDEGSGFIQLDNTSYISFNGGTDPDLINFLKPVEFSDTITFTGNVISSVNITDTTDSTSKDTGCLILEGGLGIEKNVYCGGSIIIKKTTGNDTLVFAGTDDDNHTILVHSTTYVNFDSSSNTIGLYKPTSLVDTTQSTSTSTGCLILSGGIGIAKDAYINGITNIVNTTTSTSTSTGCLVLSGGLGVAENTYIGGDSTFESAIIENGILDLTSDNNQTYNNVDVSGVSTILLSNTDTFDDNTMSITGFINGIVGQTIDILFYNTVATNQTYTLSYNSGSSTQKIFTVNKADITKSGTDSWGIGYRLKCLNSTTWIVIGQ